MSDDAAATMRHVFSIGHSNHALEAFVGLLKQHRIDVLADVRSHPFSRYASQFNRDALASTITGQEIRYHFLGRELGGRPPGAAYYDAEGYVLYARVAASPAFRNGIARLTDAMAKHQVAIMCSEEEPVSCHRRLLVARVVAERGLDVVHIRGDGRLQTERDYDGGAQGDLFGGFEERAWRSTQSVSPARAQLSSSSS